MKINQIIKEKRKQLGLTQENVAEYLGVSSPGGSKWVNGTTYPGIMLLPALARLNKIAARWRAKAARSVFLSEKSSSK